MQSRLRRVIALLFILSVIAAPQSFVLGQELDNQPVATPVVPEPNDDVENGDGDKKEDDSTEDVSEKTPGDEGEEAPGSIEAEGTEPASTPAAMSRSSIAPADFTAKTVPLPTYDAATETMIFTVDLESGFSASAGQTFQVTYSSSEVDFGDTTSTYSVVGIDGLIAQTDPTSSNMVFTFENEIDPLGEPVTGTVAIPAGVEFEECRPSLDPYAPERDLWFSTPTNGGYIPAIGPECPASPEPQIDYVSYDTELGFLGVGILLAGQPAAGQQLTLTYEQDQIAFEPGPFEVLAVGSEVGSFYIVGTATASDGLITIDIFDANIPADREGDFIGFVEITGWLQGETCADTEEPVYLPGGTLEFVSNSGLTFSADALPSVCNLDGPGIVGEWDTNDLGEPIIHWTIDTGDLVQFAGVDSLPYAGLEPHVYDCDSLSITSVYGEYSVDYRYCSEEGFYYDLEPLSEEPFRATINVTTELVLDPENLPLSVMNCVDVWMMSEGTLPGPDSVSTLASNGWGGQACYEMFLDPDGGDFLNKSVDKAEALPGETLTYTVEASTSTNMWNVIDLGDTLPAGFQLDPDSITCTVEPAMYELDPCFVQSDSTLRVQVRASIPNLERPWESETGPVSITLTYQGEVTGEPGTVLASEACSVRSYIPIDGVASDAGPGLMQTDGDQSVIGGGQICSEASTLVLQPDEEPTETPTQEPTETPTAEPTETLPPATPTETAEPEEKRTVIRVQVWDERSIEGAPWSLYAPVASQVMVDPYLTGVLDANNSAVLIDLPAGGYRFVVEPEGMAQQEFMITVSDQPEEIVVQIAEAVTPVPTNPVTPGATVDPTATSAVTGLPSTGSNGPSAVPALFVAAIAASILITVGIGIQVRPKN